VIGVHSPEFAFEQDPERVRRFTVAMDLGFPVAIDSDLARVSQPVLARALSCG